MRTVEITRAGDVSVADQMAEMHEWLRRAAIDAAELEAVRILKARVVFRASFASAEDAERFRQRFDEAGVAPTVS